MSLRLLVTCTALAGAFASRTRLNTILDFQDKSTTEVQGLCDSWLVVEYKDGGNKTVEESKFGSFRFAENEWSEVTILKKTESNGCVKTYIAECGNSNLKVIEKCGETEKVDDRCLGGTLCMTSTRKSSVNSGDSSEVYDPEAPGGMVQIDSGLVTIFVVDPNKGIDLSPAPGNYKWKAEWGCYCCKHSYSALNNPFSYTNRREAWKVRDDGNMECMLAWKMIGNGMADNPAESSAWGVLALIPETVVTLADMMTLTIGRHLACASTCPLRKAKYEANKYSFTKIQTDMDKY